MTNTQIQLAMLCPMHQSLLVHQTGFAESDPWVALYVATQIALFQALTCDDRTHRDTGGDVAKLGDLGCAACRKPDSFGEIIATAQHAGKDKAIGAIKALGESWIEAARASTATAPSGTKET